MKAENESYEEKMLPFAFCTVFAHIVVDFSFVLLYDRYDSGIAHESKALSIPDGLCASAGKEQFMVGIISMLDEVLFDVVQICTIVMELFGVCVLVYTACKSFLHWIKRDECNIRLDLAQGIALALEFKMGGEVLRTVVVREWAELGILGAIILLRGLLTFLIHWEIKNEQKELEKHH